MNLSEPFIRRPVATSLMAGALAFLGLAAFPFLPVAPLPQVDFPTVLVTATLAGASAETMASSVATPLERQIGQIAGITEMTSFSALGATSITVQFEPQSQHRSRRPGCAGGDHGREQDPAADHDRAADLQEAQSGRCADFDPVGPLGHPADHRGRRICRQLPRPADFPGDGRRPGLARRRAAPGDPDPGRSCKARHPRPDAGGNPRRTRQCDDQCAQGLAHDCAHEPDHRGQRPDRRAQTVRRRHHRLSQWRPGAGTRHRSRRRRRYRPFRRRLSRRRPGDPALGLQATGRQYHRHGRTDKIAAAQAHRQHSGGDPRSIPSSTAPRPFAPRSSTSSSRWL